MRVCVCLAAILCAAPSAAQDADAFDRADALGTVLAAEDYCGLAYDHDGIAGWIAGNVPAGEMEFPALLQDMTAAARYRLEEMSPAEKTAHCTQIGRIVADYGFVAE